MLLSGTVPSSQDVGGIILRDLVNLYPPGRLCCFAVRDETAHPLVPEPSWLPLHTAPQPFTSGAGWDAGLLSRGRSCLRYLLARHHHLPRLAKAAVEFGRKHEVELVWAVLAHPLLYRLASMVADLLRAPLVVTVWDPPESVALNLRLDRTARGIALRDFAAVMGRAERAAVMGETMADEYARRFDVETVIMRHGVDPRHRHAAAREPNSDGRLTIGFSGSLYATREWGVLLSALARADWRVADRAVRIRALTPSLAGVLNGPGHVEWLGWRPTDEAVRMLAECDVNYLPYWFDPSRREAVRLCFPTKLTSYLAAGRPVLFHGPRDSSPPAFFERYSIASCCHTLEEEDVLAALADVVDKPYFYSQAAANISAAIDEEFTLSVFRARFAELVGVEQHALTPVMDFASLKESMALLARLAESAAT
jgi:glycosyltransferase involved in cell wall biosynthesis